MDLPVIHHRYFAIVGEGALALPVFGSGFIVRGVVQRYTGIAASTVVTGRGLRGTFWVGVNSWKRKREGLKHPPLQNRNRSPVYTLKELPQPQVLFTLGLLNLKPEPSMDST